MAIHLINIAKNEAGGILMCTFIENGQVFGVKEDRLRDYLTRNNVENIGMVNGLWKGTQGDLHRYVDYHTTVLGKFIGAHTGYELYIGGQGIVRCSEEQAYDHISRSGATNAKAVRRAGKNSIVPLKGKFVEYRG